MEYTVVWNAGRCKRVCRSLQNAIILAREKAIDGDMYDAVTVWNEQNLTVALVTDDANGVTVHRLATWPADAECAY